MLRIGCLMLSFVMRVSHKLHEGSRPNAFRIYYSCQVWINGLCWCSESWCNLFTYMWQTESISNPTRVIYTVKYALSKTLWDMPAPQECHRDMTEAQSQRPWLPPPGHTNTLKKQSINHLAPVMGEWCLAKPKTGSRPSAGPVCCGLPSTRVYSLFFPVW